MTRAIAAPPGPGEGKTYSLFGDGDDTTAYYECIRQIADELVMLESDLHRLVEAIRRRSRSKRYLKSRLHRESSGLDEGAVVRTLNDRLSKYTVNVATHLQSLPMRRRWDRVIAASEEQYHSYMLEVEIVNRANVRDFGACDVRLALLPHCLHDVRVTCQSVFHGHDHVCKSCSKECVLNGASKVLRRHGVTPYIWLTANLRQLLRRMRKDGKTVGVFGIACFPELVRGMRMCMKAGVPVVGLPLDANRCGRWWGEFYPNSVNLTELERLMGEAGLAR